MTWLTQVDFDKDCSGISWQPAKMSRERVIRGEGRSGGRWMTGEPSWQLDYIIVEYTAGREDQHEQDSWMGKIVRIECMHT